MARGSPDSDLDRNPNVTLPVTHGEMVPVVQLGTSTLRVAASRPETLCAVDDVLALLEPDDAIHELRQFYRLGLERFGEQWGYLDLLTVLGAAARYLRPRRYLEIGVLGGRSMSVVASVAPDCELFGFDAWLEGYSTATLSGPEHVRTRLRRVGHRGACHLVAGPSAETVPRFLADRPDLRFDLVTVDGDHGEGGARADLEHVLPRITLGGVIVFDDVRHPQHPWLERVWDTLVGQHHAFCATKYVEVGNAVAFAVRQRPDTSLVGMCPLWVDPDLGLVVRDYRSHYAPEPVGEQCQVWLPSGPAGLSVAVWATEAVTATLEAFVAPGPGRRDAARTLDVACGATQHAIELSGFREIRLPLRLGRGTNHLVLGVVDRADGSPHPPGDTRELMVLVSVLRLTAPAKG